MSVHQMPQMSVIPRAFALVMRPKPRPTASVVPSFPRNERRLWRAWSSPDSISTISFRVVATLIPYGNRSETRYCRMELVEAAEQGRPAQEHHVAGALLVEPVRSQPDAVGPRAGGRLVDEARLPRRAEELHLEAAVRGAGVAAEAEEAADAAAAR